MYLSLRDRRLVNGITPISKYMLKISLGIFNEPYVMLVRDRLQILFVILSKSINFCPPEIVFFFLSGLSFTNIHDS